MTKITIKPVEIKITVYQLLDLIHWARRYCDGRKTPAPHQFNLMYWEIINRYPDIATMDKEKIDITISNFPFAQDGMYEEGDSNFDAIPAKAKSYVDNISKNAIKKGFTVAYTFEGQSKQQNFTGEWETKFFLEGLKRMGARDIKLYVVKEEEIDFDTLDNYLP